MERKASTAAFSLNSFKFVKVGLDYELKPSTTDLNIDFKPSGIFDTEKKKYQLRIDFSAYDKDNGEEEPFIDVSIVSDFDFKNVNSIEEIPTYFYKNSIAIIYPYIRAFVSNVSLQANIGPLILPTLNLSMLEDTLRENTTTDIIS